MYHFIFFLFFSSKEIIIFAQVFSFFHSLRRRSAQQPLECWPFQNPKAPTAGRKSYIHEAEER